MHTDDTRAPNEPSPFDALRQEMATLHTPPGVRKELMAAFAAQHRPPPRWYQKFSRAQWRLAAALGCTAAVLLAITPALLAPRQHGDAAIALVSRDDSGAAFIALDSFERIEQDPAPRMVEATVPRTSLAALGVPVSPENAGDMVRAEMVIGSDGHPLALRLASQ
jgi:anti-sigma-K factor RskA